MTILWIDYLFFVIYLVVLTVVLRKVEKKVDKSRHKNFVLLMFSVSVLQVIFRKAGF